MDSSSSEISISVENKLYDIILVEDLKRVICMISKKVSSLQTKFL